MRILAVVFGAAAAFAVATPVAADPAIGSMKVAQAQDSGSQSGSSMGAKQQGSSGTQQRSSGSSAGERGGSTAASHESSGGAATSSHTQSTSRTTVRERSG